jgi:hypothetical protein
LISAYETDIQSPNLLGALQSGLLEGIIRKPVSNDKLLVAIIEKVILQKNNNNH